MLGLCSVGRHSSSYSKILFQNSVRHISSFPPPIPPPPPVEQVSLAEPLHYKGPQRFTSRFPKKNHFNRNDSAQVPTPISPSSRLNYITPPAVVDSELEAFLKTTSPAWLQSVSSLLITLLHKQPKEQNLSSEFQFLDVNLHTAHILHVFFGFPRNRWFGEFLVQIMKLKVELFRYILDVGTGLRNPLSLFSDHHGKREDWENYVNLSTTFGRALVEARLSYQKEGLNPISAMRTFLKEPIALFESSPALLESFNQSLSQLEDVFKKSGATLETFIKVLLHKAKLSYEVNGEAKNFTSSIGKDLLEWSPIAIDEGPKKHVTSISFSAVNSFLVCPLQYWLKYKQSVLPKSTGLKRPAAVLGQAAHEAIQKITELKNDQKAKNKDNKVEPKKEREKAKEEISKIITKVTTKYEKVPGERSHSSEKLSNVHLKNLKKTLEAYSAREERREILKKKIQLRKELRELREKEREIKEQQLKEQQQKVLLEKEEQKELTEEEKNLKETLLKEQQLKEQQLKEQQLKEQQAPKKEKFQEKVFSEKPFRLILDSGVKLHGTFDQITIAEDGVILKEYKANVGQRTAENSIQLLIYSYAYEIIYGTRPKLAVLECITQGTTSSFAPSEETFKKAIDHIQTTVNNINQGLFKSQSSYHCLSCSFTNFCPASHYHESEKKRNAHKGH